MQNKEEVIKVSDWSQKYKLAIYAVSGVGIIIGIFKVVGILNDIKGLLQEILLK